MKTIQKIIPTLALALLSGVFSATAQVYVTVRPSRPVYVRPAPPSPRHVWVEEDWNGAGGAYEWRGGVWVDPPTPGYRYRSGYWRESHRGYTWVPGGWRSGRGHGHGHGHGKGHGKGHHKHK